MEQNPYEAPAHYAERPRRPWIPTRTGTKIGAAVIGFAGYGQLAEGSRLGDTWRIGGGLVMLTVAVALWIAGDHPFWGRA